MEIELPLERPPTDHHHACMWRNSDLQDRNLHAVPLGESRMPVHAAAVYAYTKDRRPSVFDGFGKVRCSTSNSSHWTIMSRSRSPA
jgi:hypothetical protein